MWDIRPTETVRLCCGGTGKDERTRVSERTEAAMRLYNQTGSAVRARPAGNGAGDVGRQVSRHKVRWERKIKKRNKNI